jgi:hypothetical protein
VTTAIKIQGAFVPRGQAFQSRGLDMPKITFVTFSERLMAYFFANAPFIGALPFSEVHLNSAKVLPVGVPLQPWSVVFLTLKNRALSPVVERFIECAHGLFTQPGPTADSCTAVK